MSASESEFIWVDDPEDVEAPRADRVVDPAKRVTAHAYKSGHLELRTAQKGEYLNTTHPVHTRDFR